MVTRAANDYIKEFILKNYNVTVTNYTDLQVKQFENNEVFNVLNYIQYMTNDPLNNRLGMILINAILIKIYAISVMIQFGISIQLMAVATSSILVKIALEVNKKFTMYIVQMLV